MTFNFHRETTEVHTQSTSRLLLLLLCTDVAFIILHIIYFQTELIDNSLYSLSRDNGYAEFFQYTKFLWIILLLLGIVIRTKLPGYIAWTLLFIYFLADDALQVHEYYGRIIAGNLEFVPPMNLRLQDIGELIVTTIAGVILFPFMILAYWRRSQSFRKVSRDMWVFIIILVAVGVGVDMVHESVGAEGALDHLVFRVLEEGGEMIVTSFILWYIFLLSIWNGNVGWYVHERLRAFVSKRAV